MRLQFRKVAKKNEGAYGQADQLHDRISESCRREVFVILREVKTWEHVGQQTKLGKKLDKIPRQAQHSINSCLDSLVYETLPPRRHGQINGFSHPSVQTNLTFDLSGTFSFTTRRPVANRIEVRYFLKRPLGKACSLRLSFVFPLSGGRHESKTPPSCPFVDPFLSDSRRPDGSPDPPSRLLFRSAP